MVAVNKPDISHLSAYLNDRRGTFYLEILDYGYRIAVLEYVSICILDDAGGLLLLLSGLVLGRPFVSAFRTYEQQAILVGVLGIACGAVRKLVHDEFVADW